MEYGFRKAYGRRAYDVPALQALQQAIYEDPRIRGLYTLRYAVGNARQSGGVLAAWKAYWCGITRLTAGDFTSCYCTP